MMDLLVLFDVWIGRFFTAAVNGLSRSQRIETF